VNHLLAFLVLAAVVIVVPGPDTALTVRNTLLGGRRNGIRTAAGVSSGQAVWTLATSAGVAALVAASQPLFTALRVAGAAYLVWLGLHGLHAAIRGRRSPGTLSGSSRSGYRQGLLSNLGNPKMAVFFTSLLPQFSSGFAELLALGLAFCTLTLAWLSAYAAAVARAQHALRRPRTQRALDALTGVTLVAFGVRLAGESR
jgi:threonine/homoserine/homoserine lactone efflux protein